MKPLVAVLVFALTISAHAERINVADDDAAGYGGGWNTGTKGGSGFGPWSVHASTQQGAESHAGFYVGGAEKTDLTGVAIQGKALGMYANGVGFESAVAFRPLGRSLENGDTFSFLMEHGTFVKKWATDDAKTGSIGLTLLASKEVAGVDDYNKSLRFEFGYYEGKNNYQVVDAAGMSDTGVAFTDAGLSISVTLTAPDTYDLEITVLATKKTTKLAQRKLGGPAGAPIVGFVAFARDVETNDVYFNGFQVSRDAK